MGNLTDKINSEIKKAMLAKESKRLEALRAVKSALLLLQTEKGASGEISEDAELKTLQRLVKQRKESATMFIEQNRQDLAEVETFQADVIEEFLPEQMSEEELQKIIEDAVKATGAETMKDMGKVMGMVSKQVAGKADNKTIATIIKHILSK